MDNSLASTSENGEKSLSITKGMAMLYYCFDVGYEIHISHLEKIRGKTARQSLLSYSRLTPPYIQYKVPPLLIRIGKRRINIDNKETIVLVDAKVYDFGVITIRFTLSITGDLEQLHERSIHLTESKALRKKAIAEFLKIKSDILQSISNPRDNPEQDLEDYAIFMVQEFERPISISELLNDYGSALARVLRGEKNLSTARINDALKNPLSYYENDLTLIDWNAALIFDPDVSYDIADVTEFALIQLLELRLYDQMLDTIIDNAYDALIPVRYRVFPFSRTLQNLSRIKLDISEIIDHLMYHLKLIGDLYLAKVYETASKRFYLEQWKSAVRGKLSTIASIYNESWARIQTNRMIVLEIAIVVFFFIDIIFILIELFK
ncbi:MAG: hypothetical protein WBB37_07735 [bacterium]